MKSSQIFFASLPGLVAAGPYPAGWFEDPSLPEHTIYRPLNPPADTSMPVMLWGNGGCLGDGLAYEDFLTEVASHGILIIANGWVTGEGQGTWDITKDLRAAGSGDYANVDAEALGVSGHSCGGWQTVEMRNDPAVKAFAAFGYGTENPIWAADFSAPVGFFVGSLDTSIALPQIEGGWPNIPDATPAWWGTFPGRGHEGTFDDPNGGVWAQTFAQWVFLTLKGDSAASDYFNGGGSVADGWIEKKQNLEGL